VRRIIDANVWHSQVEGSERRNAEAASDRSRTARIRRFAPVSGASAETAE